MNSALYLDRWHRGHPIRPNEDKFTVNFGVGARVLATDWLALHHGLQDHIFATDLLGSNKATNNL